LDSNGSPVVPFSQDHVKKLVNDFGFPEKFFIDHACKRRLSAHITTRTGDCWLMRDWLFSVVTMQRTRNNDMLSIIVSDKYKYSNAGSVLQQYILSRTHHRHPLFPIALIANAALEDYAEISEQASARLTTNGRLPDTTDQQDPTAGLAGIAGQRERLTRVTGQFKAFDTSVRNLLTLHDGKDASSRDLISLQSLPAQAGGKAIPDPLSLMLQYIVGAMGDILERTAATDTRLQTAFLVVRIRDAQDPKSALVVLIRLVANPPHAARH
jgi:hypothetical protein